jgi:hypothetical protein
MTIVLVKLSLGTKGKSPFWKTVEMKMELVNLGARVQLGNDALTNF